jgi:hypothetical protein
MRRPAPARLIAIGDVHGDLAALRAALRLGGAIDAQDHWSGGALVVVQTGDLLDRGDDDREVLDAVERWSEEAARAGGAFVALNGNHEVMNVQGDFRYVTPGGFDDFHAFAPGAQGRAAAFAPGGPYARRLAGHLTVVIVGDTVFVHGGLLPSHVAFGLDRLNEGVRAWMLGRGPLPTLMNDEQAPVWFRGYALDGSAEACAVLGEALRAAGARRMVVGHTVQREGINSACDGRVWRIDVGLARYYHGPTEVLEIAGDRVRVLRAGS